MVFSPTPPDLPAFAPGNAWDAWQQKAKTGVSNAWNKAEADAFDLKVESYIPAEHVYVQMARNFPPKSIEWVRRAKWTGPVYVSWESIDTEDKEKWAAAHEPGKVADFKKQIKAHDGHVAPSVLVRQKTGRAFIVDGHHRALAREELDQPVLAYIGTVGAPADYQSATETHSSQLHSGSDPQNKAAGRVMVSKTSVNYRPSTGVRDCANCVMFHGGTCDLVKGEIKPRDICDRWEPK